MTIFLKGNTGSNILTFLEEDKNVPGSSYTYEFKVIHPYKTTSIPSDILSAGSFRTKVLLLRDTGNRVVLESWFICDRKPFSLSSIGH